MMRDLAPFVRLKKVKNTHGEVLLLVVFKAEVSHVIITCINKEPKNLDSQCPELLIIDIFKGQMTNKVKWLLQKNPIILQNVPLDL